MLSERKKKQMIRRFESANLIIHDNGIEVLERHNMWVGCIGEAKEGGKDVHAQHIFVEKCIETWPDWFKGVRL